MFYEAPRCQEEKIRRQWIVSVEFSFSHNDSDSLHGNESIEKKIRLTIMYLLTVRINDSRHLCQSFRINVLSDIQFEIRIECKRPTRQRLDMRSFEIQ